MATAEPRPFHLTIRFAALVDQATASHGRALFLLALVTMLAMLPGFFSIPPVDRDEVLFAQITRQMVESGDYIDIRYQDQDFYKKPAGINWLQAMAVKAALALGDADAMDEIWVYRTPSLLGAVAAVLLTYWAGLVFLARRPAFFAALMLAVSLMVGVQGRLARTDAVLLAVFVAVLGSMARIYLHGRSMAPDQAPRLARRRMQPAIFWTALAVGILLKGPFILLFALLVAATLVFLDRSIRWLGAFRPLAGVAWMILLVAPWVLAIVARTGTSFFVESIGHDTLGKVAAVQEAHGAPPGYYLVFFAVTFWPGAALAGLAVPHVLAIRRLPWVRFLLAWIVPAWIIFELVPTKLPHYVLPLFPAIAMLIAEAVERGALSRSRWLVAGTVTWLLMPLGILAIAIGGLYAIAGDLGILAWPFALGAVLLGLLAWRRYQAEGAEAALLRTAAASLLLAAAVCGIVVPAARPLFPSVLLADAVRDSGCPAPKVATVGFEEPSLVFLLGKDIRLTDAYGAVELLKGGPCRLALVESSWEYYFNQRAQSMRLSYEKGPLIEGINITHAQWVKIRLYRSTGPGG